MVTPRAVLLCVAMILTGCTVLPTVQYRIIESAKDMDGMTDSFYRQRSEIELSLISSAEGKDVSGNKVVTTEMSITSKPREYRASKLGIHAIENWRTSTVVSVTKAPNTDRVSSIGIEVTDKTVKAIGEYGGAIVKIVSAVGAAAGPDTPCLTHQGGPKTITLPDTLTDSMSFDGAEADGRPVPDCITVKLSPLPADALQASAIPVNTDTHNYYYSACRDAEITVRQGVGRTFKKTVRVSDPQWVQLLQFPPKGTITHHSECGISVQTDKATSDSGTAAIIDALATQGKAIKDALEAGKK